MLSRGENISEQTLAVEAAALLKALQQRTKEEPDAYKRPMYIGIPLTMRRASSANSG